MGVDRSQCSTVIINAKRVTLTAHFVNSDIDTNYGINDIRVIAFVIPDGEKIVSFEKLSTQNNFSQSKY